jgi:ribosomal protein S27AE
MARLSLALIIGSLAWARHAFRCPICGASVFLMPISAAWPWITGKARRCANCGANYDTALRETSKSRTGA